MVMYNICKGRALRIAVGITMLILLLVGGAGAAMPISACTTISLPGTYVLTQNIVDSTVSSCITITANNVIFDGAGFTIAGGGNGNGVYVVSNSGLLTNVTVKNLKVTNWNYGIYYRDVKNNGTIITASACKI